MKMDQVIQVLKVILKPLMMFFTPLMAFFTEYLATILKTEKEKIFDAPKLVDAIKHEMEMAKKVLKEAEAKCRDEQTNKKVTELREMIFKIEDIIDDYKLLEQERYLDKLREENYNNNDNNIEDDNHNSENDSITIIVMIFQCFSGIWGTLTRGYKAMIRFKNKHGISCRIVEIRKTMEKIKGEKGYAESIFNSLEGVSESENTEELRGQEQKLNDPEIGPLYKDEKELIGFEERKREIFDKLQLETVNNGKGQFVLAIWGLPGVGKTTLARKVYEDKNVRKCFSCYAWITATEPYKRVDLLKSLCKQFANSSAVAEKEESPKKLTWVISGWVKKIRRWISPLPDQLTAEDHESEEEKVEKLKENEVIITDHLRNYLLKNHKDRRGYLVVFDDVSEKEELCDILKAALVSNDTEGGRIMITTNSQRIANYWKTSFFHGDGETYNLRVLSNEDATDLFNKKAFGTKGSCPWKLKKIRDTVVRECDGLPLLIEKVGARFSITDKWIELYQEFQTTLLSKSSKTTLISSYHEMPSHLKPCFLYLCMFPKGEELDRMRIVRLWIAEGFVEAKDNTPEETAEEYLNELVERGMIRYLKKDETERNRKFRLPNMWYHIMLPKLEDLNFCLVLPQNMSNVENQCRRLSIHKDFSDTLPTSTLRVCSILSFVRSKNFPISWPLPRALFLLKVLDLQDAEFVEVPKELGNLHNLKYLCFRNTTVKELPDTIGGLRNLQTLDLKQSPITNLPRGIISLNKLRYLLIGRKKEGERPDPVQIPYEALRSFTELQKLTFVDGSSEPLLLNLGKLTQLRRLGIVNLKGSHGENLCQAMLKMKVLRSLSINAENELEILDLTYIQNSEENSSDYLPEFLERLYLRGSLKNGLPGWLPKLRHLVKLLLRNSRLEEDPVAKLRVMQELLVLELDNAYTGQILDFESRGCPKLRVLRIKNLLHLERIEAHGNSLPELHKAKINECPKLKNIPPQISRCRV